MQQKRVVIKNLKFAIKRLEKFYDKHKDEMPKRSMEKIDSNIRAMKSVIEFYDLIGKLNK